MSGTEPLSLYQTYEIDDILRSLNKENSQFFDGSFVLLPSRILCFFQTQHVDYISKLRSPLIIEWENRKGFIPKSPEEDLFVEMSSFDAEMFGFYSHQTPNFIYIGKIFLASFVSTGPTGAAFSLENKLPYSIWIELGGYKKWRLSLNALEYIVDDNKGILSLAESYLGEEYVSLRIENYDQDEIIFLLNQESLYVSYTNHQKKFSVSSLNFENKGEVEIKFKLDGRFQPILEANSLPREKFIPILSHFLEENTVPSWIHWKNNY